MQFFIDDNMKHAILILLKQILADMGVTDVEPEVEILDDPAHGDYSTSVALKLSKVFKKSPMDRALQVAEKIKDQRLKIKDQDIDQNIYKDRQTTSEKIPAKSVLQDIDRVEAVAPGFINFFLTEAKLSSQMARVLSEGEAYGKAKKGEGKRIMVEYAHPNTHKAFHIGHLRNITTGESVVRLLEAGGNKVIRVNYQGDVGMHIAKALYALLQIPNFKSQMSNIKTKDIKTRVEFLGKAYAAGSKAFEENESAKAEIIDINALIYAGAQRFAKEHRLAGGSFDYLTLVKGQVAEVEEVYKLWKETRQWSLDYFDSIYKRVGSHFDRLYFESECLTGVDRAKEAVKKGILKESEGAIIFDGKPYGIDTRVFVNSLGLPTYEGKELALAPLELSEFGKLDKLIHVVGPEQASFFKVTFKAEELLGLQKDQQYHFIYGWVKLKQGKMSSRSGNVILGEWLLDEAEKEIYNILQKNISKDSVSISKKVKPFEAKYSQAQMQEIAQKAAVAAVKYSFLRVAPQNTIAFDLKESVSFDGDSGPYLQYTYARCKSVLRKADRLISDLSNLSDLSLNREEKTIVRLIFHFPEIVAAASTGLAPNMLCSYLFRLAQAFNLFYAKHSILGGDKPQVTSDKQKNDKNQTQVSRSDLSLITYRLSLTAATAQVLKNGLYLLGIETLEQM